MRKRIIIVALVLAGLIVFASVALVHFSKPNEKKLPKTPNDTSSSITKPPVGKLTGSYLVSGDVFWGRGIDYYAQKTIQKYDWPFLGLKEFHPEKYDGWISDLECPVTSKTVPYQTQVDKLILQCPPAYTAAAAKFFTAFTVANNHTDNTGVDGFSDTRLNLTNAGIQFFGHFDLGRREDLCEVISLPSRQNGQVVKMPIAMCGYHWLARYPSDSELAEISRYGRYFPVWVFPHGGTEYAIHHSAQQQALYRQMIDLGADVVFGDHPHVVEDTEAYKGKLIVYNLGNLIYDQWFDGEVTKSLIVNIQLSAATDSNLSAYLNMGKNCQKFKDNCLQEAINNKLAAPKLNYKYEILAGDSSNASIDSRLKRPASSAVYEWLIKRTNWQNTTASLR